MLHGSNRAYSCHRAKMPECVSGADFASYQRLLAVMIPESSFCLAGARNGESTSYASFAKHFV